MLSGQRCSFPLHRPETTTNSAIADSIADAFQMGGEAVSDDAWGVHPMLRLGTT